MNLRSRKLRWIVRTLALLFLLCGVLLYFWIKSLDIPAMLAARLSLLLNTEVTIDQIQMPGAHHAVVEDVAVQYPDGGPSLYLKRMDMHFSYTGLWMGRMGQIVISNWETTVTLDENGLPILPSFPEAADQPASATQPPLKQMDIALYQGKITVQDASANTLQTIGFPSMQVAYNSGDVELNCTGAQPAFFKTLKAEYDDGKKMKASLVGVRPDLLLSTAAALGLPLDLPVVTTGEADIDIDLGDSPHVQIEAPSLEVASTIGPSLLTGISVRIENPLGPESEWQLQYRSLETAGKRIPASSQPLRFRTSWEQKSGDLLEIFLVSLMEDYQLTCAYAQYASIRSAALHLQLPDVSFNNNEVELSSSGLDLLAKWRDDGKEGRWNLTLNAKQPSTASPWGEVSIESLNMRATGTTKLSNLVSDVSVSLQLDRANFSAMDGLLLGEGVSTELQMNASYGKNSKLAAVLSASSGVALYDTLFISLSEFPLHTQLKALFPNNESAVVDFRLTAPGTALSATTDFDLTPFKEPEKVGGHLDVELSTILPVVLPTIETFVPLIENCTGSGRLALTFNLTRSTASGKLETEGLDLLLPSLSGLLVSSVKADMPFSVSLNKEASLSEVAGGRVTIGLLSLPGLELEDIELHPRLSRNRLELQQLLHLEQYGGVLEISNLLVADVLDTSSEFICEGKLKGLDLGQAGAAAGVSLFEGVLDCPDFSIKRREQQYFLNRPLRLQAFGGEVVFDELSIEEPGSPYSQLRSSATIKSIDLARLTSVVPIGHISGILEGHARDLLFVGGEEERFDIDIHTVPTRGVKQEISAQALVNLLSGAESNIPTSLISRFKKYGYGNLGLQARLEQGILHLRGTRKTKTGEYFMVGRGFNKLNIVLHGTEKGIEYKNFRQTLIRNIENISLNNPPDFNVE
jgi:hypothetical protein